MKTRRSQQASKLLKACSAITGLGPFACWPFNFWLCGLHVIIFCYIKTDCVINYANSKFQWKNIYTCRWLCLDEPLWTNWLHIPYNINRSCDVALNTKQCCQQINNLIRISFFKSAKLVHHDVCDHAIMRIFTCYQPCNHVNDQNVSAFFPVSGFISGTLLVFRQYLKSIKCSWYAYMLLHTSYTLLVLNS